MEKIIKTHQAVYKASLKILTHFDQKYFSYLALDKKTLVLCTIVIICQTLQNSPIFFFLWFTNFFKRFVWEFLRINSYNCNEVLKQFYKSKA